MTYPKYRIYKISAKWPDLGDVKGDATTFGDRMLRDDEDEGKMREEWVAKARDVCAGKGARPEAVEVTIMQYAKRRSWAPGWFSHWTFRSTEVYDRPTALASFEQYVTEVEREFDQEHILTDAITPEHICMMGAHERWRWRGMGSKADPPGDGAAPCSCLRCYEENIWRIDH